MSRATSPFNAPAVPTTSGRRYDGCTSTLRRLGPSHPRKGLMAATLDVLVVDDVPDTADTLALLLGAWGFATRVAYGGASALQLAREHPPDCIVTDLGMPGVDGFALAAAVRADPALAGTRLV